VTAALNDFAGLSRALLALLARRRHRVGGAGDLGRAGGCPGAMDWCQRIADRGLLRCSGVGLSADPGRVPLNDTALVRTFPSAEQGRCWVLHTHGAGTTRAEKPMWSQTRSTVAFFIALTELCAISAAAAQEHSSIGRGADAALVCPGTNRALVFSGGGLNGAYQLGATWYLINGLGCEFQQFVGTSTGAIAATLLSQASNREELKNNLGTLVTEYRSLRSRADIITDHSAAYLRLFLPNWLGGIKGLATLDPLERMLRRHIKAPTNDSSNLSVLTVSLQAGTLDPSLYKVDSLYDLIIGSASVPLIIEPRLAKVWVYGAPLSLTGDRLVLDHPRPAGIADPDCRLRISAERSVKCTQSASIVSDVPDRGKNVEKANQMLTLGTFSVVQANAKLYQTTLVLEGLSNDDRTVIKDKINPFSRRSPYLDPWAQPRLLTKRSIRSEFMQFSTIHQLVDGAVTDNTPLEQALQHVGTKGGVDTVVLLLGASTPAPQQAGSDYKHTVSALSETFSKLWSAYQTSSFQSQYLKFVAYKQQCELASIERPHKDLASLLSSPSRWCQEARWKDWDFWVYDAGESVMSDFLEIEPEKVAAAVYLGCVAAAADTYYRIRGPAKFYNFVMPRKTPQSYGSEICAPLRKGQQ
jgi:predicted acylesterase/phospholipase RssA